MKPENKGKITLSILAYGDASRFDRYIRELAESSVKARVVIFSSDYMEKTLWAARQPFEYTAKIDEDVFVNNHVLDFIVENITALDDPRNLVLTPILTNGIPTCDLFLDQVFDERERAELHKIFLETRFGPLWGTDYSFLNKYTVAASKWDSEAFYASVAAWPHHYKGIHPVRVNLLAQMKINEIVLRSKAELFVERKNFRLKEDDHPYLCNNLFFIRTDKWRRIVEDQSLYVDSFDEVPLSRYKQTSGEKWVVVDGSFGIHTMFNAVYGQGDAEREEERFVRAFARRLGIELPRPRFKLSRLRRRLKRMLTGR